MDIAALIAWVVTAGGGFVLLGTWVAKGGLRQQETSQGRLPPTLVFGHFLLAAVGLLVWIAFVVSDDVIGLAWTAFALLVPVALLGFVMFWRWLGVRRALASAPSPAGVAPEQHFPLVLVVLHGLLAVTTLVLVLLAAIDAT